MWESSWEQSSRYKLGTDTTTAPGTQHSMIQQAAMAGQQQQGMTRMTTMSILSSSCCQGPSLHQQQHTAVLLQQQLQLRSRVEGRGWEVQETGAL